MNTQTTTQNDLTAETARIVASYVSNHNVPREELEGLIQAIYQSLSTQTRGWSRSANGQAHEPAVPVNQSVTSDYVICLEDGKKMRMLKRYLRTQFNMTPEQYRAKWNLPANYPMTAPNYSKKRSAYAKQFGLGRQANNNKEAQAA